MKLSEEERPKFSLLLQQLFQIAYGASYLENLLEEQGYSLAGIGTLTLVEPPDLFFESGLTGNKLSFSFGRYLFEVPIEGRDLKPFQ